jgi:two-component system response regulator DevR
MNMPVRLFLVAPAIAIRHAVATILDAQAEVLVVGEAGSSKQALTRVPAARPDVVLVGQNVRAPDPPEMCRLLREALPSLQILLVAANPSQELVAGMINAGAAGVLPHTVTQQELVDAIKTAAAGRMVMSTDAMLRILRAEQRAAELDPVASLTPLEQELFVLVGEGLTNAEIAERLHLSLGTVRNYVSRLLRDLGFDRRAQVVVLATTRKASDQVGR